MSFDLNILCCYQDRAIKSLPFSSAFSFRLENKKRCAHHKGYDVDWQFMNSCPGYWYSLEPVDYSSDSVACYDMCDIIYDGEKLRIKKSRFDNDGQFYANTFEYIDFLPVFNIKPEFRRDFEEIILYFIEQSPVNMIIFLARFQGDEKDVIQGVFPKEEFFQLLDNRTVKFNHCYIVGNESGIP